MNFFIGLVEQFQKSEMYQGYLINLPEGLNNPYFLLLIILGIIIFLIITVKNSIMAILLNSKNKKRIAELREQQLMREEERQRKEEAINLVLQKMANDNSSVSDDTAEKTVRPAANRKKVVGISPAQQLEEMPNIMDVEQAEIKSGSNKDKNLSLLGIEETHEYSERELYNLKNAKEIKSNQPVKDDEVTREKIDYNPILNEKMSEDRPQEEADGLDDILSNLKNRKANDEALRSFEEKNAETRRKNLELLDRQVKNSLRVENQG